METVRPHFPKTIVPFQARFGDEEVCLECLYAYRGPEGYSGPRCQGQVPWPARGRGLRDCAGCRHQVSLSEGTVLHKTHAPLLLWCRAAYLMTTGTPGISAIQLQRQLGLTRYQTA
ncbi:IS1595 family transposase [Cryobacterium psychrophilum]|uniref:IS1595 family transposase n=1 Tax=Cryobacterium psychrophilum TaxID=41988 RepID=A0A4Y8KPA3_9MICO|nr:IS1595 family transposase [Cryobacterium psychrophilum]